MSETTKRGMASPEVKAKLAKKRKSQSLAIRQKHSDALAGKMPKNNTRKWGNIKSGRYDINGKTIFFRSRWEANYALYLDFLIQHGDIVAWKYEPQTFIFGQIKLGTRSYTPDFSVTNSGGLIEYHEVKGWMDPKSKTKLKRMAKYYPSVKIVLVDAVTYRDIQNKLGRVCGFLS